MRARADFFAGYDSMPCQQQKCLVHLIRDLNDDLWSNTFNVEYERFVDSVRYLLIPILDDVQRFGLKSRHLRKHQKEVDRFYRDAIDQRSPPCELVGKYHQRFLRYRESLFAFLHGDGIPWNNNVAERAIRPLAVQRKISGFFYSRGAERYLRLLGIAQTCRFQHKSFLRFLLSDLHDVDRFKAKGRRWPTAEHPVGLNDGE